MGDPDFIFKLFLAIIGVIFALALAWAVKEFNAAQKRVDKIALTAWGMGLEISPIDIFNIPERYKSFYRMAQGFDRKARSIIHGKYNGYDIIAFDYEYRVQQGKQQVVRRFSAVVMTLSYKSPSLLIRPEGIGDKLAGAVGFDDIDFESNEFSRCFYVKSEDKRFAYDVLHPRMMDFLLGNQGWAVHMLNGSIMFSQNRLFTPEEFKTGTELVYNFVELLPDYLRQRLQHRSV